MASAFAPFQRSALRKPRPAGWVVACLWLLVALMPLRAWAASGMAAAIPTGPMSALHMAQTGDEPEPVDMLPCHGALHHESATDDHAHDPHHSSCAQCLFCSPLLGATASGHAGQAAPGAPPAASPAGDAPEGAVETLFRPPRG